MLLLMLLLLIVILLAIIAFPTVMAMLGVIMLAGMGYGLLVLLPIMGISLLLAPWLCSESAVYQARRRRRAEKRRDNARAILESERAELRRQAQAPLTREEQTAWIARWEALNVRERATRRLLYH
jgi:uncharacterized membrane protein